MCVKVAYVYYPLLILWYEVWNQKYLLIPDSGAGYNMQFNALTLISVFIN